MSDPQKIQSRYDKLKELQKFYEIHKKTTQFLKFSSLTIIGIAWILTLFFKFTLPFFFLHTIGTSLWFYHYVATNPNLITWKNYLTDPVVWFLSIVTIISGLYVLIAAGHCSLNGYFL